MWAAVVHYSCRGLRDTAGCASTAQSGLLSSDRPRIADRAYPAAWGLLGRDSSDSISNDPLRFRKSSLPLSPFGEILKQNLYSSVRMNGNLQFYAALVPLELHT